MKKLFKTLAALAVVAALGFGFVSCGGGDDDSSSGGGNPGNSGGGNNDTNSALAIFSCDAGYDQRTLTFFADSTFKVIVSDEPEPQAAGTYKFVSGDWENGTITFTATSGYKQETFTGTKTISEKKITFSTKTYTLTGGTLKIPSDSTASETKKDDTTKPADESGDSGNSGTTKTDTPTTATVSATFKGKVSGFEAEQIFYSDGTYLSKIAGADKYKGTYKLTGTWDSGSVILNQTNEFKDGKWVEAKETENAQIVNGKVDLGDGDSLTKVAATDTTETAKEYNIWVTRVGSSDFGYATYTVPDKAYANTLVTIEATKGTIKSITGNVAVTTVKEGKKYTFTMPEKDVRITITSTGEIETVEYKVYHSFENLNGEYVLDESLTQTLTGYTGRDTEAQAKEVEGFVSESIQQAKITANTSVTIKYTRINVTIKFDSDGGSSVDKISGKYGTKVTPPTAPTKEGYIFENWTPALPETFTKDLTVKAQWKEDNSTYKVRDAKAKGKIGDVLLNDGTVVSYKENMSFTDEQKKKAVSVLAYFNDKGNPVGLGLHNSADGTNSNSGKYKWAKNGTIKYYNGCTYIYNINCTFNPDAGVAEAAKYAKFSDDTDGSDNWEEICWCDKDGSKNAAENYPAFDYVNKYAETFSLTGNYAEGWYMPSLAELAYIFRNKATVNAVLEALGGTQLTCGGNEFYWSSSQKTTTKGFETSKSYAIEVWKVGFYCGQIYYNRRDYTANVCCVRAFSN